MSISCRILAALAAVAFSLPLVAAGATVRGFIRPTAAIVSPTSDGYGTKFAPGLSGGLLLGEKSEHEISLEILRAEWNHTVVMSGVTTTVDEAWMPVLFNYRYYIGSAGSKTRFYVGPSLGFSQYKLDMTGRGYGQTISDGDSEWSAAVSAGAGVQFALSDRFGLEVGYRYISIKQPDITILDTKAEGEGSFKAHILSAAVSIRF